MSHTLAIHWAATTYGTWLHGDPRGSWRQGHLIGPDPFLEAAERASMSADSIRLDAAEQKIVADTFGDVVRQRNHQIFTATIQPCHVHLVFGPISENIDIVVARLKRRSAAAVLARRRVSNHPVIARSLWSSGKFKVFIFDERHLLNTIEYVRDHNRRAEIAADPFDWISPLYPPPENPGERIFVQDQCVQPRL